MERGKDHRKRVLLGASIALLVAVSQICLGQPDEKKDVKGEAAALETIPDPPGFAAAVVAPVNPLFQPFEKLPALAEVPAARAFRGKATVYLALKLDETGKVLEAAAVDPPLQGLTPATIAATLRWTFDPARKDGKPVRTWAALGLELTLDLEQPVFTSFSLLPIAKDAPIPVVAKEFPGDTAVLRYPKAPPEPESGLVSIEEVDSLPAARKTPWRFDALRLKSRLTAVVQVSPTGSVERIIPTGASFEPFVLAWVRGQASKWKIVPASDRGVPKRAFMNLDLVLEYEIAKAKDSARRVIKKNLRGSPAG